MGHIASLWAVYPSVGLVSLFCFVCLVSLCPSLCRLLGEGAEKEADPNMLQAGELFFFIRYICHDLLKSKFRFNTIVSGS